RRVALGDGLAAVEVAGLRRTPERSTWQVAADGWLLRARAADGPRDVRILFAEAEASRGDDGRWVWRMTSWLAAPPAADLRWRWPAPVRLLRAGLDGGWFVPPAGATTAYDLAVGGRTGLHAVVLEW